MPTLIHAAISGLIRSSATLLRPALLGPLALGALGSAAQAQQMVSDRIQIVGDDAFHWTQDGTRTVMIEKNVKIVTEDATMTADRAVVWLSNKPGEGNYAVQIALLGNAKLTRGDIVREAPELFVNSSVKPDVKLEVITLTPLSKENDVHYLAATQLRRRAQGGVDLTSAPTTQSPVPPPVAPLDTTSITPTTEPTTQATTKPVRLTSTVNFRYERARMESAENGNIAMVLSGNVALLNTAANGDAVELQADNVVVFTRWKNIRELFEGDKLRSVDADRDIEAVYLEGDVRINITPAQRTRPEQSLRASRAVYEFDTQRAILTDALLHSSDPALGTPLVIRAQSMKKLGEDHYEAERTSITTSSFATPAMTLSAKKVSVREVPSEDRRDPSQTHFKAVDVMPRIFGVPVFWLPRVWGTSEDGGLPLRDLAFSSTTGFGYGIQSTWGLFQTLGTTPPEGLDAQYRLDYYSERGPAFGVDANYAGGFVNESTLQPWNYLGNFTAYGTIDDGVDRLGKQRARIQHENDFRGRVKWNHQQFLTDNWQVQARVGYTSDATFLEEWFRNEFRNGLEQDASLYLKRSQGSEVLSGLVSYDISNTATVADQLQETAQFGGPGERYPVVVERLPELQYHRLGESLFDDRLTWISNNSVAGLHFSESYLPLGLTPELDNGFGLRNPRRTPTVNDADVGIPSYAWTGVSDDYVVRGDFRQEISQPMGDDKFRIAPYGVVRYTAYSDSPEDEAKDRILGGVGIRASTQFFKVYDGVQSDLLDVHRLRHVVEPQMHLFASAQTTDRQELYQYDEGVDGISDIMAANFNIRQRFQTKRGAPGRERSVDFLTLNTGIVLFANEPDEIENLSSGPNFATADAFRGVFFGSMPEASIPRSTAYADLIWRVTDTTAILSDVAFNAEQGTLATAATGVAVSREPRTRYYAGVRYIGETNSTIGTFTFDYAISERYSLALNQTFSFQEDSSQSTNFQLIRRFEQFIFTLTVYLDQIDDEGGITFSVSPRNLPFGLGVNDGIGGRR
jgi:lipopolysaccharide export system protein LptA